MALDKELIDVIEAIKVLVKKPTWRNTISAGREGADVVSELDDLIRPMLADGKFDPEDAIKLAKVLASTATAILDHYAPGTSLDDLKK